MTSGVGVKSGSAAPAGQLSADLKSGVLLAAALSGAAIHNFLGIALFFALGTLGLLLSGRELRIGPVVTHTFFIAAVVGALALLPNVTPFMVRFEEVVRFSSYVLLAICLASTTKRSIMIAILLLLAVVVATFPIYLATGSFAGRGDFGERRFSSIFIHANHLAYACALMSLVAVIDILKGIPDRSLRKLTWTIFFVSSMLLIISRSSGGLLALVVGALVAAVTLGSSSRKLLFLFLFGGLLALVFVFTNAFETFVEKFLMIDMEQIARRAQEYKFGGGKGSLAWRMTYWTALFDAHMASGTFHVLFGSGGGASSEGNYPYFFMVRDPHNDFIKLFIEYGMVGTVLIVLALFNLCRQRELLPLFAALCVAMFSGNTIGASAVMAVFFMSVSAYAPRSYYVVRARHAHEWKPAGTQEALQ